MDTNARILPVGLATAAALTMWAQQSHAADLPAPRPPLAVQPVVVQPAWSGFYFGSETGGIVGSHERTIVNGGAGVVAGGPPGNIVGNTPGGAGGNSGAAVGRTGGGSFFGGLYAGYNWQRSNIIYGLEGDIGGLGSAGDVLGGLRAHVGVGNDSVFVYGAAGLSAISQAGGLEGVFIGGAGGNGGGGGNSIIPAVPGNGGGGGGGILASAVTGTQVRGIGVSAGIGAAVKLSPDVSVGAEALYHAFNLAGVQNFVTVTGRLSIYANPLAAFSVAGGEPSPYGPWGGLYVGGDIGTLFGQGDRVIDSVSLGNGEAGAPGTAGAGPGAGGGGGGGGGGAVAFANLQNEPGLTGGAYLGYNWLQQSTLFGLEAGVDASSKASDEVLGSIRGRLGWLNQGHMFYGTAGVAVVHDTSPREIFAGSGTDGGTGGNGTALVAGAGGAGGAGGTAAVLGSDQTKVGFVAGLGYETQLTSRTTVGIEGLYYRFSASGNPPAAPPAGTAFAAGRHPSDALVLSTRFSVALQ